VRPDGRFDHRNLERQQGAVLVSNVVALPTRSLVLTLSVTDAEVLYELDRREEGPSRDDFAAQALRLGVLALRQASGSLDADVIRREGEQLLGSVGAVLQQRNSELSNSLLKTMVQYLDPASGALPQRIDQLTKPNGDLDALLARNLDGDQSLIAQTLARHIGEHSPIFKLLSPTQSGGLMAVLTETLQKALNSQRDEVLKQFSLDQKDSALSRLVFEVTTTNGKLQSELAEDMGKVVREFSLDNQDGALARLVSRVENTQTLIENELSLDFEGSALRRLSSMVEKASAAVETSLTLDDDASPLARLKREILGVLAQHRESTVQFQSEVRSTLDIFKARKDEAARAPQHGVAFEDSVGQQLQREAERVGDICEAVGVSNGRLQRKVGDFVLELGPESASPGARIVVEAKAKKRCTIKAALGEMDNARRNREAQVGLFVFDRDSAPVNIEPLHRVGVDIFVVWDAEDAATDVYLRAAFGLARSLAHREVAAESKVDSDFAALDQLIEAIGSHVTALGEIEKAARSVKKNGEVILTSAQAIRDTLERETDALRKHVDALRVEE
jgi:hypothetical protein